MKVPPSKIKGLTFHIATVRGRRGQKFTLDEVTALDGRVRKASREYAMQMTQILLDENADEPYFADPWCDVEVEIVGDAVRRVVGPMQPLVEGRINAIKEIINDTLNNHQEEVDNIVRSLGDWMLAGEIVHVIGAGRALLAASIPANRLAHGGANVYILGDKSPPPNSRFGGGMIAASASGRTPAVLDIMKFAKGLSAPPPQLEAVVRRPVTNDIKIIGIADRKADDFRSLCTKGYFLGIEKGKEVGLRGLADIEEYAISELLDALVVAAGTAVGVNFRLGHEDLVGGATGPWHQHGGATNSEHQDTK